MKERLWLILALSCFATLGNGQDGALPPTPANGWGVQGNTAWTQAQHRAELEKAALAARQKKAMMESMASVAIKPPTITTAEQYLEYYKPATPRSPAGSGMSTEAIRSNSYVPEFQNNARTGGGNAPSNPAPPATVTTPEKKSLFGLFKSKEKEPDFSSGPTANPYSNPLPPSAAYPEPAPGGIGSTPPPAAPAAAMAPADPAAVENSLETATAGAPEAKKPSLFGRLFSKEKETAPPAAVAPPTPYPAPGTTPAPAAAPAQPSGIPSPPSFDGPAPAAAPAPAPAPAAPAASEGGESGGASIFVNRSRPEAAGQTASVLSTTQATVSGVLVRLYEGTQVSVLERSGSMARVRLPDGREGTIAASALSR